MFSRAAADVPRTLAVTLLICGIVGLVASYFIQNPYSTMLPLATLVAAGAFLATRAERSPSAQSEFPSLSTVGVPARVVLSAYFVVLAVTVFVYHSQSYQRTTLVHLLVLGCYALAALLLFTGASRYLKLGVIVSTGVAQRAMAYYASPLYLGNDVFAHNRIVQEIAASGSLEPLATSKYYYAAFYHLLVSVQHLVTGVSVRHVAFATVAVALVVVPAIALFLLTNRFWGERAAMFAALLYTGSDFAIHWAIQPQVTSLGIVFFALILLLGVSYVHTARWEYLALYFVLYLAIALTHQVSTVITFLALTIFLVIWAGLERRFGLALVISSVSFFIMFVVFNVTEFNGPEGESPSFFVAVLSIWESTFQELLTGGISTSSGLPADAGVVASGSAALNVWHVAGTSMLLGAAIFGGLHWLSAGKPTRRTGIALGGIVAVLFPTVLAGPVVGLRVLIPWRWFAFIYVPLAILAAPGIVIVAGLVRDALRGPSSSTPNFAAVAVVVLLIGPYIFFMGGDAIAARDGAPLDDAPGAERYAVTEAELATLEHSVRYVPRSVPMLADFMFAHNILERHYGRENVHTISMERRNPDTIRTNETAVLVNRDYMQSGHTKFRFGTAEGIGNEQGTLVHGVIPVSEIDPHAREVIYDAESSELVQLSPAPGEQNATAERNVTSDQNTTAESNVTGDRNTTTDLNATTGQDTTDDLNTTVERYATLTALDSSLSFDRPTRFLSPERISSV